MFHWVESFLFLFTSVLFIESVLVTIGHYLSVNL